MVKLKLNTSASTLSAKKSSSAAASSSSSSAAVAAAAAATGSGSGAGTPTPKTPKIKLKTKASVPTLKLKSSSFGQATPASPLRTPVLKLKTPKQPAARKRRHEPGNGYDSEASDREEDPAIEEQFILRMPPGADCEYVREAIERKELNPKSDIWFKFKDARRAVVCVRGNLYAGVLVDLPNVIESNKTLDKKAIFKTADICQMLLVGERIRAEDEVFALPVRPQDVTYPHGLTPPMQWVRKRRFRKRISNRTIEAVEAEVDRLLRDDERAETSDFMLVDAAELAREEEEAEARGGGGGDDDGYDLLGGAGGQGEYDDEQDAEGEMEYDFATGEEMDGDTLANDLETALMDEMEDEAAAPEESEDEEDDEEEEPELDEEAAQAAQEQRKLNEEIQDLQEAIKSKAKEYDSISNVMLKARIRGVIASFQAELELKLTQLEGAR
ncbi:TAFII55 protein conserved region-domain-containing protein [Morchella snyderi]|nr:TAFII55 protein conserved region-domain-containing protein [Morchella snyderi]